METPVVRLLIQYRYWFALCSIVLVALMALGGQKLVFDSDYKSFFDASNPQLIAFDDLQAEYTASDNMVILLKPEQGDLFTKRYLQAIVSITESMWQAPFGVRVDSLSNYQFSWGDGDDLIVEDLIALDSPLTPDAIARIKQIALSEKELVSKAISKDGKTTAIVVSVDLPTIDSNAPAEQQTQQRADREASFKAITDFGNSIIADIAKNYPELNSHMLGVPVLNYNFNASSTKDALSLLPAMYGMILIALGLFLRSIGSVFGCLIIIAFATVGSMGWAGWVGYTLNSMTVISPIIILTIAVCDCVHLIVVYLRYLSLNNNPLLAMGESLKANIEPIVLTSITTAVGFLTLNFSGSPYFRDFGNLSAFGVMFAMLLTLTLMPTLTLLLVRHSHLKNKASHRFEAIPSLVIARARRVLTGTLLVAIALMALIPLNHVNNDPINFFKQGVPYRNAADFAEKNLPGIKEMQFSIDCGSPSCISDPEYLQKLERFTQWFEQQYGVVHIISYTDVLKRLNRNMHGEDNEWYRLPDSRDLAAQYHLLYELSLPYGLDLNNLVNLDKSATRVTVALSKIKTGELITAEENAVAWLEQNAPDLRARGSSVDMMFAVQNIRDIKGMSLGAIFALIGVTLTILIATRSLRHSVISMVPNAFPAAMGLGIWGVIVGEVNMAVCIVFSITLGLVVDNTVHFISKYRRALTQKKPIEEAIYYAFSTVGPALMITAAVLSVGFGILSLSTFNLNAHMGGLTALTIIIALVFDLLMLPALLMLLEKKAQKNQ